MGQLPLLFPQVFVVAFVGMGLGSWAAIWEFIQNTSDFGVFAECAHRQPALAAALQCTGQVAGSLSCALQVL